MPTPKKPEDRRQKRNNPKVLQFTTRPDEIPPVPAGMLKSTQRTWRSYWRSPLAAAADTKTDLPALTRLWTLYDERERASGLP